MEIWVLIYMKSHLWSQASETRGILATDTQIHFHKMYSLGFSTQFSNLTTHYHSLKKQKLLKISSVSSRCPLGGKSSQSPTLLSPTGWQTTCLGCVTALIDLTGCLAMWDRLSVEPVECREF